MSATSVYGAARAKFFQTWRMTCGCGPVELRWEAGVLRCASCDRVLVMRVRSAA